MSYLKSIIFSKITIFEYIEKKPSSKLRVVMVLEFANQYFIKVIILKMCLCLGPFRAGKTLLLRNLRGDEIDEATSTVKTDGLNLFDVRTKDKKFELSIKELGGSVAPIWTRFLDRVYTFILNDKTVIFLENS